MEVNETKISLLMKHDNESIIEKYSISTLVGKKAYCSYATFGMI